jgi:hypothetical protein
MYRPLFAALAVGLPFFAPGLLHRALATQDWFRPEIIDDAAARFVIERALSAYMPMVALPIALLLIVSSILLLRHGRSRRS